MLLSRQRAFAAALPLTHRHSVPSPLLTVHSAASQRGAPRCSPARRSRACATNSTASAEPASFSAVDDFVNDARPVILFDGVCNMCNGAVDLMLQIDQEGKYRMAALQSPAGRRLLQRSGRAADDISSIVLVEKDKTFIKSDAVLFIASRLGIPLALVSGLGRMVPHFVRDPVYDVVADNRYSVLGKRSCRMMEPRFKERFLVD